MSLLRAAYQEKNQAFPPAKSCVISVSYDRIMDMEGGVFLREGRRLTMHCFRNKLCRRLNATFDVTSVSGLGNFESKKSIPPELTGRCESSSVTPHWHGKRAKCLKSQVRRNDGGLLQWVKKRMPQMHE